MELTKEELKQLKNLMDKANAVDDAPKVTVLGKAVVVTTSNNGIFFGYTESTDFSKDTITLNNGRNCWYYENGQGFLGLSVTGPSMKSKVGARAKVTLRNVTSVSECSDEAIKAWEKTVWK